jgi:hypothetical protein
MFGTPVVSSRPEPVRPARVPEPVKQAIVTMVETGADFVAAGKQHGVTAQMMRRWLGRSEAITYLRKERSRFRQSVCAQNEYVLADIRDHALNSMSRVHAVRTLEQLADGEVARPSNAVSPGVTIVIRQAPESAPRDITPRPPQALEADEQ